MSFVLETKKMFILLSISVTIYIIFNSPGLIRNILFSLLMKPIQHFPKSIIVSHLSLHLQDMMESCSNVCLLKKKVGCIFLPFPRGRSKCRFTQWSLPSASDNSSVLSGADDANMELEHSPPCQTTSHSDVQLYGLCC